MEIVDVIHNLMGVHQQHPPPLMGLQNQSPPTLQSPYCDIVLVL